MKSIMYENSNMLTKKKYKSGMVEHPTPVGYLCNVLLYLGVIICVLIALLPMWHVVMSAISSPEDLYTRSTLVLLPIGGVSFEGFRLLFSEGGLWVGWINTIIYVCGTVGIGFVLNVLGGYALSRKTKLRKAMILFLMVTVVFGGGMVPTYMVMNELGLVGTRWAIILPESTMAMYLIVGMNAFLSVPESTVEASQLDGAGHLTIMFRVMLPQCASLFVVTIIYTFVASYNSWVSASIYVPMDRVKWPLQMWINEIINNHKNFMQAFDPNYGEYLVQFCVTVMSVAPLMIAFPFFQKKMEAGMILGGVKG